VDVVSSTVVSLVLLVFAAGLMLRHLRVWRRAQRQEGDRYEADYQGRQFRRRMQTSAMLGLLAVAIFVGSFITDPPEVVTIFWICVLLVACWVALLAMTDLLATKLHFGRVRAQYLTEQARLQAEIRRIQARRHNGAARKEKSDE
jgi:hypothetical protein